MQRDCCNRMERRICCAFFRGGFYYHQPIIRCESCPSGQRPRPLASLWAASAVNSAADAIVGGSVTPTTSVQTSKKICVWLIVVVWVCCGANIPGLVDGIFGDDTEVNRIASNVVNNKQFGWKGVPLVENDDQYHIAIWFAPHPSHSPCVSVSVHPTSSTPHPAARIKGVPRSMEHRVSASTLISH